MVPRRTADASGHIGWGSTPLHRNRDFILLWMSQVLSTVGSRVSAIAYPLLVLAITGSPAQAGIVAFAESLPFLLVFLPAGALVDRWDRRRTMVGANVVRSVALGSVALAVATGNVTLVLLVVVAFVEGATFVFFDLCEGAALPRVVHPDRLPTAVAVNQARTQGADLVGQPLGGVLFSVGRAMPFVFGALVSAVSLATLLLIRTPLQEERAVTTRIRDLLPEIGEGLRIVWATPFLRAAVAVTAGVNWVFSALMLVLIVRAQDLGADAALIGGMFAFFGAGGIVGAIIAPWIRNRIGPSTTLLGSVWLWVVMVALLPVMPTPLTIGVVAGMGVVASPSFNVVIATAMYEMTPDRLLGRVRSVAKLVAWGAIPFGSLAGGVLAGSVGAMPALTGLAGIMLAVAMVATASRSLRSARR
jgi:MFS family permease